PQMHAVLMAHVARQGLARLEGGALRYVSSGAAPLDPAWKRKAEAFYGLPLQNGYGMTETTAVICATSNAIGDPDISVGPALPGVEIALDARHGGDDPDVGEILTRGPHVMDGYYRNSADTALVLADDWMRTGDLGRMDGDRLHVVGRAKELIIRGGFNVYPPEVESALNDHPDVIQCAVVGRRVDGDEQVLAFVQCAEPDALDVDALQAFAATRLAAYKRPTLIVAATNLPAAPTGKILKHKLISTFATCLADFA
ncbi:MAG: fatty acid--CoA ligase family protein, partial [Pseudomonadota bacterium]